MTYILFRMSKETFYELLKVVQCPELSEFYGGGGVPLTTEKALLVTLWWLGKGDPLISISDRINIAVSTAHHYSTLVVGTLVKLIPVFIKWPNQDDMRVIERQFWEVSNYPGVLVQ